MKSFINHKINKQKKENNTATVKVRKPVDENDEKQNYIKKYPLHYAVSQGDLKKVAELLQDQTIGIDSRDHNIFTPLHIAVGQDHCDIVIKLLVHGADPNV